MRDEALPRAGFEPTAVRDLLITSFTPSTKKVDLSRRSQQDEVPPCTERRATYLLEVLRFDLESENLFVDDDRLLLGLWRALLHESVVGRDGGAWLVGRPISLTFPQFICRKDNTLRQDSQTRNWIVSNPCYLTMNRPEIQEKLWM